MSAIHHRRLTPIPIDIPRQATFETPSLQQDKMSTLLRLFVRIEADGSPSFEIAAPPGVLHYLFPPGSRPGMETCPFFIQHIPTNRHELVADLSSVLNTHQLKPKEDHFRILPTATFVRERMAQQIPVYPPPSVHPTHLRLPKNRYPADQDPEVADLPGYRTIWLFPADVSSYLVAMGLRYIGSHVEACGARGPPREIWDIHTFVGGEKLTMLLTKLASMSASPQNQTYEENVGTPRVSSRVTFREEDLIKM